ncbi:MAG: PEP-CTERM sorting domain-containing protein [Gammaproteobacteria bacterium]|nr:PEP-CTERM sorting domain-containing protein [Gammaproteobacteria bacterium]
MLSTRIVTKWLLPISIVMLALISTSALSENGTYAIVFKDSASGPFRGASTFDYNPVTPASNQVSVEIGNWTGFDAFTLTPVSVTSTANHQDKPGPSRVRGVGATMVVNDPAGSFAFILTPTGNNSTGTWRIVHMPSMVEETGFYDIVNTANAPNGTVPEPSIGLVLLTGLIPLGIVIRRRRLRSGH